jgi:antitoxin component YwqK of YwqJK toxin-antitoxin module
MEMVSMVHQVQLHNKLNFFFILLMMLSELSCNKESLVASSTFIYNEIPKLYVDKNNGYLQSQNDVLYFNGKKYSGYIYQLNWLNKDTLLIEGYINGKQEGLQQKWYAKNKLKEQRYYQNGWKHGHQIAYWENGNKRFEFMAVKDVYEGERKEWNNEGKLIYLATYKNGQEEGPQKLWYDNGKIRANYIIKNGKRYGLLGTKNCKNVSDSIFSLRAANTK